MQETLGAPTGEVTSAVVFTGGGLDNGVVELSGHIGSAEEFDKIVSTLRMAPAVPLTGRISDTLPVLIAAAATPLRKTLK